MTTKIQRLIIEQWLRGQWICTTNLPITPCTLAELQDSFTKTGARFTVAVDSFGVALVRLI